MTRRAKAVCDELFSVVGSSQPSLCLIAGLGTYSYETKAFVRQWPGVRIIGIDRRFLAERMRLSVSAFVHARIVSKVDVGNRLERTLDSIAEEMSVPAAGVVLWMDLDGDDYAALCGASRFLGSVEWAVIEATTDRRRQRIEAVMERYGLKAIKWIERVDLLFAKGVA